METRKPIKIIKPGKKIERRGILVNKKECTFSFKDRPSLKGDKEKSLHIAMSNKDGMVGGITLEEVNKEELLKDYIKLRVVHVNEKYQGGNAVIILYEKAIEYAESLGKKLLFDSSLTIGAYKSFKKLENYGYKIIENPKTEFDGEYYKNYGSWVLRVERENNDDKKEN